MMFGRMLLCVQFLSLILAMDASGAQPLPKMETQAMANESLPPIRRVVTGHRTNNTAAVLTDGPATNRRTGNTGSVSTLIWSTDRTPAEIPVGEDIEDMGARQLGTPPPPNGTRFTVNDIPPGRSGPMHRTETIDYVIVLSGEIEMKTDDSTVKLRAGDVLVQRGTNHAWINRGTEPARVAFILIDAKPLGIGHAVTRGATVR
jgi:quercetin dioxygenase-like cupin family protein